MSAIEEILKRLSKYPSLEYETGEGYVTVFPVSSGGFIVKFNELEGAPDEPYLVSFGGWHEQFSSLDSALNCFAFGLSSECRLRVGERGGKAYRWTVEAQENGEWVPHSTTAWLIFPFWQKCVVRYLQNDVLDA